MGKPNLHLYMTNQSHTQPYHLAPSSSPIQGKHWHYDPGLALPHVELFNAAGPGHQMLGYNVLAGADLKLAFSLKQ